MLSVLIRLLSALQRYCQPTDLDVVEACRARVEDTWPTVLIRLLSILRERTAARRPDILTRFQGICSGPLVAANLAVLIRFLGICRGPLVAANCPSCTPLPL